MLHEDIAGAIICTSAEEKLVFENCRWRIWRGAGKAAVRVLNKLGAQSQPFGCWLAGRWLQSFGKSENKKPSSPHTFCA
jgi:hypothetical protein